jgi:hypothetical protein
MSIFAWFMIQDKKNSNYQQALTSNIAGAERVRYSMKAENEMTVPGVVALKRAVRHRIAPSLSLVT